MTFKNAKELHNNDQIMVKSTKEVTEVITVEHGEKDIWVCAMTQENGYTRLHHKEII
mgnify:CR=1 FL=1